MADNLFESMSDEELEAIANGGKPPSAPAQPMNLPPESLGRQAQAFAVPAANAALMNVPRNVVAAAKSGVLRDADMANLAGGATASPYGMEEVVPEQKVANFNQEYEKLKQYEEGLHQQYPKTAFAGELVGGLTGAVLAPEIKVGGTMLRGAVNAATYGGASQLLDTKNLNDAISTGVASGLIGGALAPVAQKVANVVASRMPGAAVVDAAGNLTPKAREAARAAGIAESDIDALAPYLAETFKAKGMTPAAAREAQFKEFNVSPTQGQATQEAAQIGKERGMTDEAMNAFRGDQQAAMREAAENIVQSPYGKSAQTPATEAAVDVSEALKRGAETLKGRAEQKYSRFGELEGTLDPLAYKEFSTGVLNNIAPDLQADKIANPITHRAGEIIQERLAQMAAPNTANAVTKNLKDFEEIRKLLNQNYTKAAQSGESAQYNALIRSFDSEVERMINSTYFTGDPRAPQVIKEARKLWSEYKNTYGSRGRGDDAGRLIDSIVTEAKNPADLQRALFNMSASGTGKAQRLYERVENALGVGSPEMDGVRSGLRQMILANPADSSPQNFKQVADHINGIMSGPQSELLKRVFTKDEIDTIKRYGNVARMLAQRGETPTESAIASAMKTVARGGAAAASALLGGLHMPLWVTPIAGAVGYGVERAAENMVGKLGGQAARSGAPVTRYTAPASLGSKAGTAAALAREEEAGREQRKSGGRVNTDADKLIREANRTKNLISGHTESLLTMPDDAIVSALDTAKKSLGGSL